MLVFTLSKARFGQSSAQWLSLGMVKEIGLGGLLESRQVNAVVTRHEQIGSPSPIFAAANGSQHNPGFGIFQCKDKRCLTCPKYVTEHKF